MMRIFTRNQAADKPQNRVAEILVFLLFIAAYVVMSIFHEPWFDEAQAWQIAKYVSFKDILLTVGHYEGHPFLWYYLLAIPAKCGVPFELGLKLIGGLISAATAYLIIFKAPFPKIVRLITPFTYFFFYQYGIIVRPYGLMLLLFVITALVFHKKDEHPWPVVILLMLQCLLNAYGMVLSGGIAICWVIDILKEYITSSRRFKEVFKDRRFLPLVILLLVALCILGTIYPYPDTYTPTLEATNSPLKCLIVALVTFLGDSLITTSPFFVTDVTLLQAVDISSGFVIACGYLSLLLLFAIICASSKRNIKYFVIPYVLFAVFSAFVYFSIHHIGALSVLLFFWFSITMQDDDRFEVGKALCQKMKDSEKSTKAFRIIGVGMLCVCFLMSLYWSVGSCVQDVRYEYSYGRETSKFLKETGLDQLKVAAVWSEDAVEEGDERSVDNINTRFTGFPTLILAYYDHNFIYTFHNGEDLGYTTYVRGNPENNAADLAAWREQGIPDVLISRVNIEFLTNDEKSISDYTPVFALKMNHIFKVKIVNSEYYIYLRNDLLEEYGLSEIETIDMGFIFTAEMRERYENGEPLEDILAPEFRRMGLLDDED